VSDGNDPLVAAQAAALDVREAVERLIDLVDYDVSWEPIHLTQANNGVETSRPQFEPPTRSIGIYNTHNVAIYLGLGGIQPNLIGGAPSVPPNALLVLPVRASALELGIDPGDAAILATGDVTVYVMRFATPQPAFLGAL
jgi:hypothetical protein